MSTGLIVARQKKNPPEPAGEPRKKDTRHVRIKPDLLEMLKWVSRVEGKHASDVLDEIARMPIEVRYKQYETVITAIRKASAGADGPPKK